MANSIKLQRKDITKSLVIQQKEKLLKEAQKLISHGFWVVPTIGKVSQFPQSNDKPLSFAEFQKIASLKRCDGLGILTNTNTLYMSFDVDFKDATNREKFENEFWLYFQKLSFLHDKIAISESPSGGLHFYIKVEKQSDKAKFFGSLAYNQYSENEKQKSIITGRANTQYCCEFPTPNYKWLFGSHITNLQTLTAFEQSVLLAFFKSVTEDKDREQRLQKEAKKAKSERFEREQKRKNTTSNIETEITVWDDFNEKNTVNLILEKHGFSFVFGKGSKEYYLRSGSASKYSGFVENDLYVNFSDNAGLPLNLKGGSGRKFSAYDLITHFEYKGDYSASFDVLKSDYGRFKLVKNSVNDKIWNGTKDKEKHSKFDLKDNEFISDKLSKSDFKSCGLYSLKGGTGTGKTFFVGTQLDKVLVISRNVTTLENYEKYGFVKFLKSDEKDNFCDIAMNENKITCTYKSFKYLLNTFNISDYKLVFDEAHFLNQSFVNIEKETRFCYEAIERLQHTNTIILMSANDTFLSSQNINFINTYSFKKDSAKRLISIKDNVSIPYLIMTILKDLEAGKKVLINTNRTEKKDISNALKDFFENTNYSLCFFDSTRHGDVNLTDLQHDITVTTNALEAGKDVENANLSVILYSLDYSISASTIIQFLGRARDYKTAKFTLFFANKLKENVTLEHYENLLKSCYLISKQVIEASKTSIAFLRENVSKFVKLEGGFLVTDYFEIDNFIQKNISRSIVSNFDNLSTFLQSFNYSIESFETHEDVEKTPEKTDKLSYSALYKIEVSSIVNDDILEKFETSAKKRFELLSSELDNDKAKTLLNEFNSDAKFKLLVRKLIIETSLNENHKLDKNFTTLYYMILDVLTDFNTSTDIINLLTDIVNKNDANFRNYDLFRSIKKATKIKDDVQKIRCILKTLKEYYSIKKNRVRNGDNTRNCFYKLLKSDLLEGQMMTEKTLKKLKKANY